MIIGLVGFAQAGKDTVADELVRYRSFKKASFAEKLRQFAYALDPLIEVDRVALAEVDLGMASAMSTLPSPCHPSSLIVVSYRLLIDTFGYERTKKVYHAREMLQRLGTEAGRNVLGNNVWVDAAIRQVDFSVGTVDWVFPDVRFQNELEAIQSRGGYIVLVDRPYVVPVNEHISEAVAGEFVRGTRVPDYTILNDGDLDKLALETHRCYSELRSRDL